MSTRAPSLLSLLISFTLTAACVPVGGPVAPAVNVSVQPHRSPPHPCQNRFVAHTLDHVTTIEGEVVRTYDSNGAGLAVNDLDRDGDLDVVVNNLLAPSMIYENRLCGGNTLTVDLSWPASKNTRATSPFPPKLL
ncbi:MAG: hypothetical protein OXJ55_20300 [Caldilineaceae bacterium]|nr:hypothetical protein [Caldilineaceae bacterium]